MLNYQEGIPLDISVRAHVNILAVNHTIVFSRQRFNMLRKTRPPVDSMRGTWGVSGKRVGYKGNRL